MYQALETIIASLNKLEITTALYHDLPKAFNSVDRRILLEKMKLCGVKGLVPI